MTNPPLPEHVGALIVGAGFGGLAIASYLRRAGITDLLVIERGDEVGGTWRDNTYPGCACDVPSVLYSLSFAQNPEWTRSYGQQPEIFDYLRRTTDEVGLRPFLRTGCELTGASWDAEARLWRVVTSQGELTATCLIAATGTLSEPSMPKLPGLASFAGEHFHSARWNHDVDLTGKRVAVIGTGASAIQFVPEIADKVAHLTVFQRTAAWVIPRGDRPYTAVEKRLFRRFPVTQRISRASVWAYRESYVLPMAHVPALLPVMRAVALAHLRLQVKDPALRAKLRPDFEIACKRSLLSNTWFPALQKPHVELVTSAATSATADAVVDADGVAHGADVIIFGTGFTPTEPPVARLLRGARGRSLAETWNGSPFAHLGTTVPDFPNLFLMYGPNTNLGHSSIVYMLESQARYITEAVQAATTGGPVDVRPDIVAAGNERLQSQLATTVWNRGGCSSWYFDASGRNSTMWPTFTLRFRRATRRFDRENYTMQAN